MIISRTAILAAIACAWRTDYVPVGTDRFDYTVGLSSPSAESSEVSGTTYVRTRRWVVEERTGTWCANCPWGIYMFEKMHEKMGDSDYTHSNSDLRIGYFIIENDVHVDSREYSQQNGFSGTDVLPGWGALPTLVNGKDMWHQHVGRGFSQQVTGVPGSVPSEVNAGQTYDFTHTFTLPDNILDIKNCKLVLMLLDARDKSVLNGLELPLEGSYSNIKGIPGDYDATPVYYNLEGMRMRSADLRPGIYIEVRGGKARKVSVN